MKYLKLVVVVGSLLLTGCFAPSSYVVRNQYLLNVKTFASQLVKTHAHTVIINMAYVASPFNQLSFIYRVSDSQYLTDYYHNFATPLSQQFDALFLNYAHALGNFDPITIYNELNNADYKLQPTITHFYADYRDRKHPQAVVALNCKLFKYEKKREAVMDKTFIARIPLQTKDTESLLLAWNSGLQNVMTDALREVIRVLK